MSFLLPAGGAMATTPQDNGVQFQTNIVSNTNETSHTFSSTAIGPAQTGRIIVVGVHIAGVTSATTTVTVGGSSMSSVATVTQGGHTDTILQIVDSSGDSTSDIIVTAGGSASAILIAVWSMYGMASGATASGTANGESGAQNQTITIPSGGFLIAYGTGSATNTHTWTNATEDFDAQSEANDHSGAHTTGATGSTTITFTPASGGDPKLIIAAWGP